MLKNIFVYGAFAGVIVILGMTFGMSMNEGAGSEAFGYLFMIIAMSMIFVGVKQYRDKARGGVIKFLPAFGMGLGISAVAGVAYVISWEVYLAMTDHAFINVYIQSQIEARQTSGASPEEMRDFIAYTETMREQYANPLFRLPITFLEIFPVGLIIALISAGLLRNPRLLPYRPVV